MHARAQTHTHIHTHAYMHRESGVCWCSFRIGAPQYWCSFGNHYTRRAFMHTHTYSHTDAPKYVHHAHARARHTRTCTHTYTYTYTRAHALKQRSQKITRPEHSPPEESLFFSASVVRSVDAFQERPLKGSRKNNLLITGGPGTARRSPLPARRHHLLNCARLCIATAALVVSPTDSNIARARFSS